MLTYPVSGMDKEWEAVIAVLHGMGPVWDDFIKEVNLGVVGLGSWWTWRRFSAGKGEVVCVWPWGRAG